MAINHKGRSVLSEDQITISALFLAAIRKSSLDDRETAERDMRDLRDVLHALTAAGYAVLPQGMVDGLHQVCIEFSTHLKEPLEPSRA
jgi:hypothetical protein